MQSSCLTGASILSVLSSQETVEIWYDNIPLKPDQFLPDLWLTFQSILIAPEDI